MGTITASHIIKGPIWECDKCGCINGIKSDKCIDCEKEIENEPIQWICENCFTKNSNMTNFCTKCHSKKGRN